MRSSPHPGALRGRPLLSAPQTWKGRTTPGPRLEGDGSQVRRPGASLCRPAGWDHSAAFPARPCRQGCAFPIRPEMSLILFLPSDWEWKKGPPSLASRGVLGSGPPAVSQWTWGLTRWSPPQCRALRPGPASPIGGLVSPHLPCPGASGGVWPWLWGLAWRHCLCKTQGAPDRGVWLCLQRALGSLGQAPSPNGEASAWSWQHGPLPGAVCGADPPTPVGTPLGSLCPLGPGVVSAGRGRWNPPVPRHRQSHSDQHCQGRWRAEVPEWLDVL